MTPQKTKVLIAVKTYPTLSKKYDELVCTAGFLEDGSWIRIFPIPFRKLDKGNQFSKWQWIELDLVKNTSDPRKESYRPYSIDEPINIICKVDTKDNWAERKGIVLKNVYTDMTKLIEDAYNPQVNVSLAVLKPTNIIDFVYSPTDREWDQVKLTEVMNRARQGNLFSNEEDVSAMRQWFKPAMKIPYKFHYIFTTEDGIERKIMIEDWEVGMLYLNALKNASSEKEACEMVKKKYLEDFAMTKDLYFFMGTSREWHLRRANNPFMIIGAFYPPHEKRNPQLSFNFD